MQTRSDTSVLDALDAALVGVRRLLQTPGYRRRILDGVGADLPLSTLRVARVVERCAPEAPSIGDVADLLGIDPSTASRAVDDAVARGLVRRAACDADRRRQRLHLTDDGRALLARATDTRRAMLAEVTQGWDAADLEDLVRRLDHLLAGFDDLLGTP